MKSDRLVVAFVLLVGCSTHSGLSVTSPESGSQIKMESAQGAGIFSIKGTATDLYGTEMELLILVSPEAPVNDGWYAQVPPLSEPDIRSDGSWSTRAQIGSEEYPPSDGNTFDIAVLVVNPGEKREILANEFPIPTLPQIDDGRVAIVEDVIVAR